MGGEKYYIDIPTMHNDLFFYCKRNFNNAKYNLLPAITESNITLIEIAWFLGVLDKYIITCNYNEKIENIAEYSGHFIMVKVKGEELKNKIKEGLIEEVIINRDKIKRPKKKEYLFENLVIQILNDMKEYLKKYNTSCHIQPTTPENRVATNNL